MFDPYREWLGITEDRRPPTLYQLLGISPGETHPQVIDHSVNRQLLRLQPFLGGPKGDDARRLTEELKLARATLLDPVRRAAYDRIFGIKKPPAVQAPAPPAPAPIPVPAAPASAIPWYQDIPTAPLPTPYQPPVSRPAGPLPTPYQLPVSEPLAPIPIPRSFPSPVAAVQPKPFLLEDPNPAGSRADFQPSSSDGSFPSVETAFKPKRVRGAGRSPMILIGGALAVGLIGAAIYFATKSAPPPAEDKTIAKQEQPHETERPKRHDWPAPPPKKKLQPNPRLA